MSKKKDLIMEEENKQIEKGRRIISLANPFKKILKEEYNPHTYFIISQDIVRIVQDEFSVPFVSNIVCSRCGTDKSVKYYSNGKNYCNRCISFEFENNMSAAYGIITDKNKEVE